MKIFSIFKSISGEAGGPIRQGEWCIFLRLSQCNLNCAWCDTKYAQEASEGTELNPREVLEKIISEKATLKKVLITGGEPLLQMEELMELCWLLKEEGFSISIETNGSILPNHELVQLVDWFIFDYKTPSSRMNDKMMNFSKIRFPCTIKFVCVDKGDLKSALDFIVEHGTRYFEYWISPTMSIEGLWERTPSMVMKWLDDNELWFVGMTTQLHKLLKLKEPM